MSIGRVVRWIVWHFAALAVVTTWTIAMVILLGLAAPVHSLSGALEAVLAWLTLPAITGLWPYLLLRLTGRYSGLNSGIRWVYIIGVALTLAMIAAVMLGLSDSQRSWDLFGYVPARHGTAVWVLWTLLADASATIALLASKRPSRRVLATSE